MGFVNLKKGRNGRGVSCLSVRRGGITRKQGLYLGQNPWRKEEVQVRIEPNRMQKLVGLLVRPEGRKGLPRSEIASETAFRPFFVTVEIAQQIAGHKSSSTTRIYDLSHTG